MTEIAALDLGRVVGGAASVSSKKLDEATELALTKLSSDLKDLAKPQQTSSQQMTMLMTMMLASRMRG